MTTLTKSQKIMKADGLPAKLFLTQGQRATVWERNPDLGVVYTTTFKDPKVDKFREMREQIRCEETAIRIRKLKGAQARKAVKLTPADMRGKRWDARHNRFVPIAKEYHMKHDTDTVNGDTATTPATDPSTVANEEKNMTSTETNEVKRPRKASPKKTASKAKKAKTAKKVAKKVAKKSTGKVRKPREGNKTQDILGFLKRAKGVTRAEVLKHTGWKAVSMQQLASNLGVKLIVSEERPFTYKAK